MESKKQIAKEYMSQKEADVTDITVDTKPCPDSEEHKAKEVIAAEKPATGC